MVVFLSESVVKRVPVEERIKMRGWMRDRIDELRKMRCELLPWECDVRSRYKIALRGLLVDLVLSSGN